MRRIQYYSKKYIILNLLVLTLEIILSGVFYATLSIMEISHGAKIFIVSIATLLLVLMGLFIIYKFAPPGQRLLMARAKKSDPIILPLPNTIGGFAPEMATQLKRRTLISSGLVAGTVIVASVVLWEARRLASSGSGQLLTPTPPLTPTPSTCSVQSAAPIDSKGLITPGFLSWGADPREGAPHVFLNANGRPVGFEVEIASAIAQLMGVTQDPRTNIHYTDLNRQLQARQIDLILNGWEITQERLNDEIFSEPYYCYSQQLVVRTNDAKFKNYTSSSEITLDEIKRKQYRIGTGSGFKAETELRNAGISPITSPRPLDDLKKPNSNVDIIMIDAPIAAYYVLGKGIDAKPDPDLSLLGKPVAGTTGNYVIGFKKSDPNADLLRQEINQALRQLKQDGTLREIYERWGLWNDLQSKVQIPDCVKR